MHNDDQELLQVLAELGISEDQLGILSEQLAQADQLRNTRPENTTVVPSSTGGSVVPNYGSMVAGMFQRGRAQKDYDKAMGGIQGIQDKQVAARKRFGQALLGPQGMAPPADPSMGMTAPEPQAGPMPTMSQGPAPMAGGAAPRARNPETEALIARLRGYNSPLPKAY